ncbi:alpha/beta fold hydrolase [Alteribacter natronophilus]|uniref:alpha/beta fold hydrolase n=1 Tax=Alteribacter natronophilus TaxID=2583810 RepID=UPI00110EFB03|nr:alpha/beta hydrolase [Alteribacter natronophilus]TMW73316.1 alpha/beta hydrolase [Alteribacter natronophilus]
MPLVNVRNGPLYYRIHGEGPPVVFTHGASWNHRLWEPQVKALSEKYQVITWDVRGHGRTPADSCILTSRVFTEDLTDLLDHLNIDSAVLTGLSMGGIISMQTVIDFPERVEGLVLIGSPCTFRFNFYERTVVPAQRLLSMVMPMRTFAKAQGYYFSRFNPENRTFIEDAVQSLSRQDWSRIWKAITDMDCREGMSGIKCPVLIIQGAHDLMIRHQQQFMAETIPNARLVVVDGADHATNRDKSEEVNALLKNFLDNTVQGSTDGDMAGCE